MRTNGAVLWQRGDVVALATGFTDPSSNIKTGPMIQTWILHSRLAPQDAVDSGADRAICFGCRLGPGAPNGKRVCYVLPWQAPAKVWQAWRRGAYTDLRDAPIGAWRDAFEGRAVRLGSYGDPAAVPIHVWKRLVRFASSHTGYTHRWRSLGPAWRAFLMASVDCSQERELARRRGWRTFRVAPQGTELASGQVRCPFETHGRQCIDCNLCQGTRVTARDVLVTVHGNGAKHL